MAQTQPIRYPFNGLTAEQFFILLIQAAQALNWQMGNKDKKYWLKVPLSPESDSEELLVGIEGDVAVLERKSSGLRLPKGKNANDNLLRLTATLNELRAAHTPEWLSEQFETMMARQQAYEKDIDERKKTNQLTALEKISLSKGTHYVTYSIIGINVLIFLLMVVTGNGFLEFTTEALVKWGGQIRYLTVGGQWYRLISSTFLHAGLMHIAFNMYALYYIGVYLEPLLGRWRYLAVYLACGVLASLASTWWRVGEEVGIGASGAIFGMYGVFLALLTTKFIEPGVRKPMLRSIGFFVVFNLAYGTMGNIDNVAHIGGLLSGMVFGYLYYSLFMGKKDNIAASIVLTIALTVATVLVVLPTIKDDTQKYTKVTESFDALITTALGPVLVCDSAYSPGAVEQLKQISLPTWQQSARVLDSTNNFVIPAYYKERRDMLRRYTQLQITHTQLLISRDSLPADQYADEIAGVRKKITALLDTLNKQ